MLLKFPIILSMKVFLVLQPFINDTFQWRNQTFADSRAKPRQVTYPCSIHTNVHLHMDISILLKIYCTSYSVCNISILAIVMINLQVYKQYRLIQALLVP